MESVSFSYLTRGLVYFIMLPSWRVGGVFPLPETPALHLPGAQNGGVFLEENLRHAGRFVVDEVDCRGGLFCKGRPAGGEKVAQKTPLKINMEHNWLVVSTHLKNISQNGNLPQIGVKCRIFETTT